MRLYNRDDAETAAQKVAIIQGEIQERCGFTLSKGVCPTKSSVDLWAGFKMGVFDSDNDPSVVVMQTRELLFDTFMTLANEVFAHGKKSLRNLRANIEGSRRFKTQNIEARHGAITFNHDKFSVGMIELQIFLSLLYDFEELLADDGTTGVSIYVNNIGTELIFDEHKLIVVRSRDQFLIERIAVFLKDEGVRQLDDKVALTSTCEHVHITHHKFVAMFTDLLRRTGVEGAFD